MNGEIYNNRKLWRRVELVRAPCGRLILLAIFYVAIEYPKFSRTLSCTTVHRTYILVRKFSRSSRRILSIDRSPTKSQVQLGTWENLKTLSSCVETCFMASRTLGLV